MKAYEIPLHIKEGHLEIPEKIFSAIKEQQKGKVIFLILENDEKEDDKTWNKVTAMQFLDGYSESDAIYDRL